MTRQPWTDSDIGELQSLSALSARQAGEVMRRSAQSIQHMRNKLRSGWAPHKMPWTDDDLDFIRSTRNLTAQQVSEHLGRSKTTVEAMRKLIAGTDGISFGAGERKGPFYVGSRRLVAKTCLGCGLLLDAAWFAYAGTKPRRPNAKRTWRPRCIRCSQRYGDGEKYKTKNANPNRWKKYYEKQQHLSRQRASRHGFPWLESDHVVLRDSTLTNFEKAILLGRTVASTRDQVAKNGYTSRVGRGDPARGIWHIANPNEVTRHRGTGATTHTNTPSRKGTAHA